MVKAVIPEEEQNQKIIIEDFKTKKFFKKVSIVLAIVLILGVGLYYLHSRSHSASSMMEDTNPSTPFPTTKENTTTNVTTTEPPWNFKIINSKTNKTITQLTSGSQNVIGQWKEYLFFREILAGESKLVAYNMTTGQKMEFNITQYSEGNKMLGFDSLQIIDNDLYISIGGYMQQGAIYYMSLPPTKESTFTKLTSGRNASIKKINDKYMIIGGDGDGCGGEGDYSLFDPVTKKVTFILTSHVGCDMGDEFFDYDSENRMIIAPHISDEIGMDGKYTDIYAINLSNPTEKIPLLNASEMPKDINSISYIKKTNQLYLFGPTVYQFDIASKQLTKIFDIPEEWGGNDGGMRIFDNYICVYDGKTQSDHVYNISEKKQETVSICPDKNVTTTPEPSYDEKNLTELQKKSR